MSDEDLDLDSFEELQRYSKNTNNVLKRSVSLFRQFLGENNQFEEFSKDVLNTRLRTFFASIDLLKVDGSDLKLSSFISIKYGICKYLKDVCKVDVANDSSFTSCLTQFRSKVAYLKKKGKGSVDHREYISQEDLAKLFSNDNSAFDVNTPSGLQRKVWFDIMYFLYGRCQSQRHMRGMTKLTFAVSTSPDGRRFVYETVDEADKNHSEDSMNEEIIGEAKMYELQDDPNCPVLLFCKYLSKLNPGIECLWQRPLDSFIDLDGPVWYARAPLGKNALAGMMSEISNVAGLSKRYTNHCICARLVSDLDKEKDENASVLRYLRRLSAKDQEQIVPSLNKKKPVETVTTCDIDKMDLQEEISCDNDMFTLMANSSIEKENMSSAVNQSLNLHQNTASNLFLQQQNCVQQHVSTIDTALLSLGHNNDYQHCLDHLENINNQMIYMHSPQINHNQLNKPRQTFQDNNKPNVRNCSQFQCHFSGNEGETVDDCGRKTSVSMENSQSMGVYEGYQVFKNDDVKQEPVDPEFDKVAGSQNEGKEGTSKSLRDVLKQMVENPNKELTVKTVVENLLQQNEVLLAQSDTQALRPNTRTVKPKNLEKGVESHGSILTPKDPTAACSKDDMPNINEALVEVGVNEANESNCDQDLVCAVGSKIILMTPQGQPLQMDITYYWCNFCSYKSENKAILLQHVMQHRFHCKYCKFQAFSRAAVILHCSEEHESFSETAATLKYCTYLPDLLHKNGMKKRKQDEENAPMSKRARVECTESLDMEVEEVDNTVTSREVKQNKATKPSSAKFKQYTGGFSTEGNTENSGLPVISSVISGQQAVLAALTNTKRSETEPAPPNTKRPTPESVPSNTKKPTPESATPNTKQSDPVPSLPIILKATQESAPPNTKRLEPVKTKRITTEPAPHSTKDPEPESAPRPQPSAKLSSASGVTVSSGLCWNCGYCGFVTLSQTFLKIHLNAQHAGKAHKYVAMLVSSEEEMARIKESDAQLVTNPSAGVVIVPVTPVKPSDLPSKSPKPSDLPSKSPNSLLPATLPAPTPKQPVIEIDDIESFIPQKTHEDAEEKKIPVSYKCAHCNFSYPQEDKVRIHLFQRHSGCVIYALDMKAVKLRQKRYIFFCLKTKCSFKTKETDEYLEHIDKCTPWLDGTEGNGVDAGIVKSLALTKTFIEKTAKGMRFGKDTLPEKSLEYACIYCSYISNNNTRLKKHVMTNHADKSCIIKDVPASKAKRKCSVYFCQFCLWETREGSELEMHLAERHNTVIKTKSAIETEIETVSKPEDTEVAYSKKEEEPAAKNQEPVAKDQEAVAKNQEPAAKNQEPEKEQEKAQEPDIEKKTTLRKRRVQSEERDTPSPEASEYKSDNDDILEEEEMDDNEYAGIVSADKYSKAMAAYIKDENQDSKKEKGRPSRNAALKCRIKVKSIKAPPLYKCMHCPALHFGTKLMRQHIRVKHENQALRAIDILKQEKKSSNAHVCFCPSDNCAFFEPVATDVVNHAKNKHGINERHTDLVRIMNVFAVQQTGFISPSRAGRPSTAATGESYECLYCSESKLYHSRKDMKKHLSDQHNGEEFIYRDCIARKLRQASRFYMCHNLACDFTSEKQKDYLLHMLGHQKAKIYECSKCQWFTSVSGEIDNHMLSMHNGEGIQTLEIDLDLDNLGNTLRLVNGTVIKAEK